MLDLRGSRLRRKVAGGDFNPLEGAANLADCMLVLACGLMLAVIVSWNVDFGRSETLVGVEQGQELTELEGLNEESAAPFEGEQGYEEMGKVYRDPTSGKLYMVVNDGTE